MTTEETAMPDLTSTRLHPWMRTLIRKIPHLRETLYLLSELHGLLGYRAGQARVKNARDYESRVDPWGYSRAWGAKHLEAVREILERALGTYHFRRVLDIGCGEGWVSEMLANHCDFLLGVDIASIALVRARNRCRPWPHLHFADWDLQSDPLPGAFDLILLMGVLECFSRVSELRCAREKVAEMLDPGGVLLVTTARQSDAFDRAWWGRWLPRGDRQITEFLARHPLLELSDTVITGTHRFTLFRKQEIR